MAVITFINVSMSCEMLMNDFFSKTKFEKEIDYDSQRSLCLTNVLIIRIATKFFRDLMKVIVPRWNNRSRINLRKHVHQTCTGSLNFEKLNA